MITKFGARMIHSMFGISSVAMAVCVLEDLLKANSPEMKYFLDFAEEFHDVESDFNSKCSTTKIHQDISITVVELCQARKMIFLEKWFGRHVNVEIGN